MWERIIGISVGGAAAFALCMLFRRIVEYGERQGVVRKKK